MKRLKFVRMAEYIPVKRSGSHYVLDHMDKIKVIDFVRRQIYYLPGPKAPSDVDLHEKAL